MAKLLFHTGLVVLTIFSPVLTMTSPKISQQLQASMKTKTLHNIVVSFAPTTEVLNKVQTSSFDTRAEKIDSIQSELKSFATKSQGDVLEDLSTPGRLSPKITSFESFWITNEIFVNGADSELIQAIGDMESVLEIRAQKTIKLEDPVGRTRAQAPDPGTTQPGVKLIGSNKLWEEGIDGSDIIVGSIDTGVRRTHETIKDKFVGENGWLDAIGNSNVPVDTNGHGTHTMGTILGSNGIGVAPGARWVACRACGESGCPEAQLVRCGQFMLCPKEGDCGTAPHIVNNSWGGEEENDGWYDAVISAWHKAGIIPVFAIGNAGPKCRTLSSPGDREVIGVGSTTHQDILSEFSSVGPSRDNPSLIKPDLVAPGSDILSAWFSGDDAYEVISGTSMAAPHVAGVVALMLGNQANLTYKGIQEKLFVWASHSVVNPDENCGEIKTFPNHVFGYGRVNALASVTGECNGCECNDSDCNDGNGKSLLTSSGILLIFAMSIQRILQFLQQFV